MEVFTRTHSVGIVFGIFLWTISPFSLSHLCKVIFIGTDNFIPANPLVTPLPKKNLTSHSHAGSLTHAQKTDNEGYREVEVTRRVMCLQSCHAHFHRSKLNVNPAR
uniref:Uncharacterized protein n=1 Tax=Cacopsylla melanoneura TaxID=428564 RepID=A0A8D8ZR14_9HEMI